MPKGLKYEQKNLMQHLFLKYYLPKGIFQNFSFILNMEILFSRQETSARFLFEPKKMETTIFSTG